MIILLTTRIIPCYVVVSLFDTKGIHLKKLFTVFQGLLISASVSTDERATGEGQNCNVLDDTKGSLGRVSHFPCAFTSMFGKHSSLVVCIEKSQGDKWHHHHHGASPIARNAWYNWTKPMLCWWRFGRPSWKIIIVIVNYWVVVSNIFYFHPCLGNDPI